MSRILDSGGYMQGQHSGFDAQTNALHPALRTRQRDEVFCLKEARTQQILYVSPSFSKVWLHPVDALIANPGLWLEGVHPGDRDWVHQASSLDNIQLEYRIVRSDGEIRWISERRYPIFGSDGTVRQLAVIAEDVTHSRLSERLGHLNHQVLELVASEQPLAEILKQLIDSVEEIEPDFLMSILLLESDGIHVHCAAAPRLPEAFCQAIEGQPIGPKNGSCGTAAWLKKTIIVTDIATDPLWDAYRDAALSCGLRACWSTPIFSHTQQVLGTFAVYFKEPRAPSTEQTAVIDYISSLAAIAIERSRFRASLKASEKRYRAVFDQAAVGIARVAPDGKWLEVNQRLCDIIGYSPEELAKLNFQDITHPQDLDKDLDQVNRMLNGEILTYSMEKRYIRPDAETVWANLAVTLVRDERGQPDYFVSIVEDINQRKLIEKSHQENLNRLKIFIDHAPVALAMFDRDMFYLAASQRWRTDYGLGSRTLEGVSHYRVFPEITDAWKKIHQQGLAGRVVRNEEDKFIRKDGSVQWLRWDVRPWRDSTDQVAGIVIFTEEISERKRVLEQVKQLNVQLEARVTERTAALMAANKRLQELDELKSVFIASVSHELRTPLNAIVGFSGLLREGRSGALSDQQHDQISRIYRASQHLLALISDIIDITRLESNKLTAEISEFTLAGLVLEAVDQVRPECEQKGLALHVSAPNGVLLSTDRRRLLQCLLNLLSNAVKFTDSGSVVVTWQHLGELLELAVIDTGPGVPMPEREQLFTAFCSLSAKRPDKPGTGLGLYLTKELIEQVLHGQTGMDVGPEGKGSRFWLRFPQSLSTASRRNLPCTS